MCHCVHMSFGMHVRNINESSILLTTEFLVFTRMRLISFIRYPCPRRPEVYNHLSLSLSLSLSLILSLSLSPRIASFSRVSVTQLASGNTLSDTRMTLQIYFPRPSDKSVSRASLSLSYSLPPPPPYT